MNLSNVSIGVKARILRIDLTDNFKKRLEELGVREGATIIVTRRRENAFVIVSVLDTYYALRVKDAERVLVGVHE